MKKRIIYNLSPLNNDTNMSAAEYHNKQIIGICPDNLYRWKLGLVLVND